MLTSLLACLVVVPSFASQKLDVDGDNQADILWRNNSTGVNWLWTMNSGGIKVSKSVNTISLDWKIAGRGDFNGDGKSDVLWRNSVTGRNWIYLMDGHTIQTSKELNYIADLNWQIKEVVDLNGDGKDDILWRHASSGRTWIYLMNGTSITSSKGSQTVADLDWKIVTSGDFNGDGRGDIMWRHFSKGTNYIWLMNGTSIQSQYSLNTIPLNWDVAGAGDLNGDNVDDIIWRNNTDGRNWSYLMANGAISTSKQINTVGDQNWKIRVVGDINGDGRSDIFWRHQQTGQTYYYLMNGTSISSQGFSTTIASLDWEVISASKIARVVVAEDDCENNSSTQCVMTLNNSTSGAIEKSGDGDVFKLEVTEPGTLTVFSSGSVDVNGGLFEKGNSSALIQDDNSGDGNNFSLSWEVIPTTYYIRVMGNIGSYTITNQFEPAAATDPYAYYDENISAQIVQNKCIVCHTSNGVAAASRLHFVNSSTPNYSQINAQAIENFLATSGVGSDYLLSKTQGSLAHGGGQQLVFGSEDYNNLAEFLGLLTGQGTGEAGTDFWEGVTLTNNKETLRKATLLFAGRLPTKAELSSVEDNQEASLRATISNIMEDEGFHQFLTESANDRLLTHKYIDRGADFLDLNNGHIIEGSIRQYEANVDGTADDFWRFTFDPAQRAFARAATELIAYVVRNDRPYTEILTADYTMVNPKLSELYRSNAEFVDANNNDEFVPAKLKGYMLFDEQYQSEFIQDFGLNVQQEGTIVEWPHTGILNDPAFLQRYPSTATNRNRARSRWVQYFFLDFDIEKSAARTNDPDALADRNNPTMNNPHCTVCHIPMDPVAGAFQDYGDAGFYKDSWGGQDSLADTYKYPEDGNTPYQEGDTWYRGMRLPGFYGTDAPSGQDTLRWLAEQIIADERFATATVKFWWLGVFGQLPAEAPEDAQDFDFDSRLEVFNQQSAYIDQVASSLRGHWDLKQTLLDLVMSPWFRANGMTEEALDRHASNYLGSGRLLSPESLDRKMYALTNLKWGENYDEWQQRFRTDLTSSYKLVYGGIDSDGIIKRPEELNSIMSQVALTHAAEMSCKVVLSDFVLPNGERKLFNGFDKTQTPNYVTGGEVTLSGVYWENMTSQQVILSLPQGINNLVFKNSYDDYQDGNNVHIDINLGFQSVVVKDENGTVVAQFSAQEMYDLNQQSTHGNIENWQFDGEGAYLTYSKTSFKLPVNVSNAGNFTIEINGYTDIWSDGGDDYTAGLVTSLGGQLLLLDVESQDVLLADSPVNDLYREKMSELLFSFWGVEADKHSVEVNELLRLFEESRQAKFARSDWSHIQESNSVCDFDYSAHNTQNEDGWVVGNDPAYVMSAWRTIVAYLMTDYQFLHE